jgi:hypothetical protein
MALFDLKDDVKKGLSAPTKHSRKEHAGRVPQPGVPRGPRQTVVPLPSSPAYSPKTVRRTKERKRKLVARRKSALALLNKPPTFKPKAFHGKQTVGEPTLKSLRTAYDQGTLKENKKDFLTTPKVRQVTKQLKLAKKAAGSSGIKGITHGADATKFAEQLAKETKLDPKFVGAWVQSEGGGFGAGGEAGKENWLGVGYPGEQTELSRSPHLNRGAKEAAHFTAKWLKGAPGVPGGGWKAAAGIPNIIPLAAGKGPQAALQALEQSGWGTNVSAVAENLSSISAKPKNPKAAKRLKRAKIEAKKLGIKPGSGTKAQGVTGKNAKYFVKADGSEHLRFVPLLAQQLVKLAKASGEPIVVNSGFRTRSEQEASYADYLAGGNLAAVPGTSNHEFGLAADLQLSEKQRGLLSKFGLGLPVPGEDWHVEITAPSLRSKAGYDKQGSVSPVSVGGLSGAAWTVTPSGGGSSAIAAYAQATGQQPTQVRKALKAKSLTPEQVYAKLKRLGVGTSKSKVTNTSESKASQDLARLERRYGSHAV